MKYRAASRTCSSTSPPRRAEQDPTGADGLEIGAMVTYDELDRSPDVRGHPPILAEVAAHIEDQQIRNRGTIGGNCCLGDPTNNLPPLLIALGATMNIPGPSGTAPSRAEDFFLAFFSTAVEQGELLRVTMPAPGGAGVGYAVAGGRRRREVHRPRGGLRRERRRHGSRSCCVVGPARSATPGWRRRSAAIRRGDRRGREGARRDTRPGRRRARERRLPPGDGAVVAGGGRRGDRERRA